MPGHTFETFKDLGLQGTTFKPRVPPVDSLESRLCDSSHIALSSLVRAPTDEFRH